MKVVKKNNSWDYDKAMALGEGLLEWLQVEENIFFEEYLLSQDLYRDIVKYLSDKFEDFSSIIKKAKEIQELKIRKYGMSNQVNTTMAIFLLKCNHKYNDKGGNRDDEQSGDDGLLR